MGLSRPSVLIRRASASRKRSRCSSNRRLSTVSMPKTRTVRSRPRSSWSKQSWTAASRGGLGDSRAPGSTRSCHPDQDAERGQEDGQDPGDEERDQQGARAASTGMRDVIELGADAVADVVDLAGQQVDDRADPSVGSDDWPSRYIWRWIWRRRAVATDVEASARVAFRTWSTSENASVSIRPTTSNVINAPSF